MVSKKQETENENIENLEIINIGMVGHIDHGKTTLLSRLTGKFADEHSEELKRGITIKLGYADTIIKDDKGKLNTKQGKPVKYVTFVDAPGHEMLMATTLSGAAIMDAAILVIAANEGIKPQTREHLVALKTKNIKNIIIAQNKIDLIDKKQAMVSYKEIKEFVKGTIAENAPIIPVSAQQGINIEKILEHLVNIKTPERNIKDKPLFVVARSFDINKPGTEIKNLKGGVLGGSLKQGTLKPGDEIEIKPGLSLKKENQQVYETVKAKILSLYRGRHQIEKATPGGSLAIETTLDPYLTKSDSLSGCILSLKNQLPEITEKIKLKFNLFEKVLGMAQDTKVDPIKTTELLLLSVNTSITVGQVLKLNKNNNEAELSLKIPIVPFKGENIAIARNIQGHWRLIGWGELISEENENK